MSAPDPKYPLQGGGGCLCGAVRYAARAMGDKVVTCHCSMCRRFHGHAGPYVAAKLSDFTLHDAEQQLRWYKSSDTAERGFCARCGASLFWQMAGRPFIDIAAGTLDAPTGLKTVKHIYVASKGDYYEIADGAEQRDVH